MGQGTLILFNKGPKAQEWGCHSESQGEAGKRSPLREKLKVLNLIRKEKKSYVEATEFYGKTKSSICETMRKEKKKKHASLAAAPQTAKVLATVCNKCLVKMKKVLNLFDKIV